MRTLRFAVAALVVGVALSACGGQGAGDGTPTPTGAQSVTSPPTPDPTTPDATTPVPPSSTKRPGGPTKPPPVGAATLTGTVERGVEPNCLLLDGYLLVGGPREVLTPGAKVTVTGRVQPDMMTTCQQGTPFLVETARRA